MECILVLTSFFDFDLELYRELAMAAMNRSDWHKILLGEEGHKSKYSRLSCRDKVNTPFREMIRTLPGKQ